MVFFWGGSRDTAGYDGRMVTEDPQFVLVLEYRIVVASLEVFYCLAASVARDVFWVVPGNGGLWVRCRNFWGVYLSGALHFLVVGCVYEYLYSLFGMNAPMCRCADVQCCQLMGGFQAEMEMAKDGPESTISHLGFDAQAYFTIDSKSRRESRDPSQGQPPESCGCLDFQAPTPDDAKMVQARKVGTDETNLLTPESTLTLRSPLYTLPKKL